MAAGFASAVLALPATGDDHVSTSGESGCAEDAAALKFARQMLEQQGLGPEMVDQAMAFACPEDGNPLMENVSLNFITKALESQGLPPDQVEQVLATYEQMAHLGGGGGAGKVSIPGREEAALTENVTLNFIEDILEAQGMAPGEVEEIIAMYEQMGFDGEHAEQNDAGGGPSLDAVLDDEEETSSVIDLEKQVDPGAFRDLALADPAGTVEAAVAAAAAQRGIDPATLQQMSLQDILELLAEE